MNIIYFYNSLSKEKEEFEATSAKEVGMYTCGPTVYNHAHIGNLRSFLFEDVLQRTLEYNGYKVKRVMNITDVGHLTGDMDMGEDKMEKGAQREGKSAWEVAKFYTEAFLKDMESLNIRIPSLMPKATDYIKEQIDLIKLLEKKGFTYVIADGVYYDTSKFSDYNKLNHKSLDDLLEGARVEVNPEKRNPTDFALWKFSPEGEKRQMEWESPWGKGFPGWHAECSAMSKALLGDQLDIHCGGIDHIDVHHTNEIAQSEAAYDQPFFRFWMHNAFLNIEGGKKMAKSDDNFLTLQNAFTKKGIDPLVYRFAFLQTHYRKPMEYSEEIMKNAEKGYKHLQNQVEVLGGKKGEVNKEYRENFFAAINDDLNTPQAMAVLQEVLKSDLADNEKLATVLDFDQVMALGLGEKEELEIPEAVSDLLEKRKQARAENNWKESDRLRDEIEKLGFGVEDGKDGVKIFKL
jgi:cysteinyl-tRNA synthetase